MLPWVAECLCEGNHVFSSKQKLILDRSASVSEVSEWSRRATSAAASAAKVNRWTHPSALLD